jgi:hypothetical protein
MTAQGYIFLAVGWGVVLVLAIFSTARLLRKPK